MNLGLIPGETVPGAVEIELRGTPIPEGSMKAFMDKWGHPHIVHDNPRDLKAWRTRIAEAGERAMAGRPILRGPVGLETHFYIARPRSHFGIHGNLLPSAPPYPIGRPDLSKLIRAAEDALKGVVWYDDALVCRYPGVPSKDWGEPGAMIRVTPL